MGSSSTLVNILGWECSLKITAGWLRAEELLLSYNTTFRCEQLSNSLWTNISSLTFPVLSFPVTFPQNMKAWADKPLTLNAFSCQAAQQAIQTFSCEPAHWPNTSIIHHSSSYLVFWPPAPFTAAPSSPLCAPVPLHILSLWAAINNTSIWTLCVADLSGLLLAHSSCTLDSVCVSRHIWYSKKELNNYRGGDGAVVGFLDKLNLRCSCDKRHESPLFPGHTEVQSKL